MELSNKNEKSLSNVAKFLIIATGSLAVGISVVCASFIAPAFRRFCLPYVPATDKQMYNVLSCLPKDSLVKSLRLLDIGSGDGRIVVAAAKMGIISHGVELNPWLVIYSRLTALRSGVYNQTKFYRKDLWKFSTSSYEYIVIFGVEQMMYDLEKKLLSEANINAKIIACRFPLPNLTPNNIKGEGVDTIWLYEINQHRMKKNFSI